MKYPAAAQQSSCMVAPRYVRLPGCFVWGCLLVGLSLGPSILATDYVVSQDLEVAAYTASSTYLDFTPDREHQKERRHEEMLEGTKMILQAHDQQSAPGAIFFRDNGTTGTTVPDVFKSTKLNRENHDQ